MVKHSSVHEKTTAFAACNVRATAAAPPTAGEGEILPSCPMAGCAKVAAKGSTGTPSGTGVALRECRFGLCRQCCWKMQRLCWLLHDSTAAAAAAAAGCTADGAAPSPVQRAAENAAHTLLANGFDPARCIALCVAATAAVQATKAAAAAETALQTASATVAGLPAEPVHACRDATAGSCLPLCACPAHRRKHQQDPQKNKLKRQQKKLLKQRKQGLQDKLPPGRAEAPPAPPSASPGGATERQRGRPYRSAARALLVGVGADELMGGYARHRTAWQRGGDGALRTELALDFERLWLRNNGRDDRVIADHGREARLPFLDEEVVTLLRGAGGLPLRSIVDMRLPPGDGDKRVLRVLARRLLGLDSSTRAAKRAIQFGSRIAKQSNVKSFGSNASANRASAGSARFVVHHAASAEGDEGEDES